MMLKRCFVIVALAVFVSAFAIDNCGSIGNRKPVKIEENNKYGLWPGLSSANDLLYGQNIFGVTEAIEKIYKNQNPPDCSTAKYLISGPWMQGFGSEFYYHGVALAIALDTGRVYLQSGGYTWRYNNDFCRNQTKDNMECYLLPYSKCTLQDALNTMKHDHPKHGHSGPFSQQITAGNRTVLLNRIQGASTHYPDGPVKLAGPSVNDPVIMVTDRLILNHHLNIIPICMKDILVCSGLVRGSEYLWWRSISITYLLRPNKNMLALIEQHRDQTIRKQQGQCVSAYIRHGDKQSEMKLQPFSAYADISLALFDKLEQGEWKTNINMHKSSIDGSSSSTEVKSNSSTVANSRMLSKVHSDSGGSSNRVFYLATEDYSIFEIAREWGKKHNVQVIFSALSQTIQTSDVLYLTPNDLQRKLPKHRELEFFSYFLHLFDEAQCIYNICTHASNFCRVIDSFRSTLGGKDNQYNVDLSAESCNGPPCWRKHSLGNYNGTVYNPTRIVWRG